VTTACSHGMPTPASCVTCMTDGNIEPPPRPPREEADSRPFPSRYDGDCPACHLGIHVGQQIVHTTRDRYVHEDCA
jgi:hypothetical protein